MKVLLDNTGVHRVLNAITIGDMSKPITYWEALGVLDFAEHIMFSESMAVSTYERPGTIEKTQRLIETLESAGCLGRRTEDISLIREDFSDMVHADFCRDASAQVLATLQSMDVGVLKRFAKVINQASKPDGIKLAATEKWVERSFSKNQRTDLVDKAYGDKGAGTFDLVIGSNEALYGHLQLLRPHLTKAERKDVANAVDVVVRLAVNQGLASNLNCVYGPAPQRAQLIQRIQPLYKSQILSRLDAFIRENGGFASPFLESLRNDTPIPLPMFAIHFLQKSGKRPRSPIEILQAARALRDSDDVKVIRRQIAKWQRLYISPDLKEREEALGSLKQITSDLLTRSERFQLYSSFTVEGGVDEGGKPKIELGLTKDAAKLLSRLRMKFSKHSLLLATLTQSFRLDTKVGTDLSAMIGHPIKRITR